MSIIVHLPELIMLSLLESFVSCISDYVYKEGVQFFNSIGCDLKCQE